MAEIVNHPPTLNSSICTFIKAKINPLPLIPNEIILKKCLNFLETFQKVKKPNNIAL